MGKKPHPLAARIKRVMQADDEVGKIAQATPFLMERALELFLQHLCERASDVAQQRGAKTVTPSHLKHVVNSDQLLDFLKDALASAADLAEGVSEAPKPKRQRAEKKEPREPKAAKTGREAAEGAGTGAEGDALQESVADVTAGGRGSGKTRGRGSRGGGRGRGRGRGGDGSGVSSGGDHSGGGARGSSGGGATPAAAAATAAAAAAAGGLAGHPFLAGKTFGRGFGGRGFGGRGEAAAKPLPEVAGLEQQQEQFGEGGEHQQADVDMDPVAAEAARIASGPSPFALADAQAGAPVGGLLAAEALATYGGAQEQEYDDDYD